MAKQQFGHEVLVDAGESASDRLVGVPRASREQARREAPAASSCSLRARGSDRVAGLDERVGQDHDLLCFHNAVR